MTTWHCPVCGLDFSFHSELDWHIREAHCLKRTAGLAGQLEREAVLSWAKMRQLASADEHPSVSLLLSTTPAAVMNPADVAELHHLASTASRSFAAELTGQAQKRMELRLEEAVRAAESGPTDHGLAVFVGATETAVVPLPFSPRKRAVVNHIFASRELLEDLQEFPMFRALVLRGPGFWLLEGQGELLSEVLDWQVPNPSLRRARHSAWTTGQRRRAAFAAADRAIGERVAIVGRLPLVVIGRKGLLTRFLRHSPHAASVVGEVLAWGSLQSRSSVAKLAGPQIAAWREKHSAQYLDALAEADRAGQVVWGLGSVWDAVRAQNVARLWVERDYRSPGNLVDGGTRLVLSDHQGHGVISDVVDLVIERAALAGAHVETLKRLDGAAGHRIAAQLGRPMDRDVRGTQPEPSEDVVDGSLSPNSISPAGV